MPTDVYIYESRCLHTVSKVKRINRGYVTHYTIKLRLGIRTIIVLRYNISPTVIYELYGRSRITTGLLYSIFGLRVPDDGTVTFCREIKLKMRFGVVHCCYYDKIYLQLIDMGGLRLQRAIETDIQ